MDQFTRAIVERGDLAHLALFLWASAATTGLAYALKELVAANKRFNAFVTEIAALNRLFDRRD